MGSDLWASDSDSEGEPREFSVRSWAGSGCGHGLVGSLSLTRLDLGRFTSTVFILVRIRIWRDWIMGPFLRVLPYTYYFRSLVRGPRFHRVQQHRCLGGNAAVYKK